MPESSAVLLYRHFNKLSDDTLRLCATHFAATFKAPDNHAGMHGIQGLRSEMLPQAAWTLSFWVLRLCRTGAQAADSLQ